MKNSKSKMIADVVTDLIGDTPLIRLNKVGSPNSAQILGKLESFNPGGSVKDRACQAMIQEAEESGQLKSGSTIIEPTSGNTGIGLAMICAVKGYRCILTMPEQMSLERNYLLRMYGAEVILTPTRQGMKGAIEKAEQLAKNIKGSYIPRQFDNRANPNAHRATAEEILKATEGIIDALVAGVGTGGTISGTGAALKKVIPTIKIVAVEPSRSAVLSGKPAGQHNIQGIGAGFIPGNLDREIIDEIITIDDNDAFAMTRRLGQEEGLILGISSGANVSAAVQVAQDLGADKTVVVILCDTGERYFSMEQYFEA